jgi:hypothetical protein
MAQSPNATITAISNARTQGTGDNQVKIEVPLGKGRRAAYHLLFALFDMRTLASSPRLWLRAAIGRIGPHVARRNQLRQSIQSINRLDALRSQPVPLLGKVERRE